MKKLSLLTAMLISVVSSAQIYINEVDADQTGTDTHEFIELLSDSPNSSLDNYLVVLFNGSDDLSYRTIDLTGFSTDSKGFLIIGDNEISGAEISLGTSNRIQNGPDAVAIYQDDAANFPNGTATTTTNLIDAIVYGTNDDDDLELLAGLGETAQYDEDLNGNSEEESLQLDSNGEYCVKPPTLRATNSCVPLDVGESQLAFFKLYPNPIRADYLNISSEVEKPLDISVFDILGKQVISTSLNSEKIDISTLASGVYLVKVSGNNHTVTKKLVVL